jgi:hypothetical protein
MNQVSGQIYNLHRLTHIEHEDLAAPAHQDACNKLDGFRIENNGTCRGGYG